MAPPTTTTVNIRLEDGSRVHLMLGGKIDAVSAPVVEDLVEAALGDRGTDVALDLTELRHVDAHGKQVFASLTSRLRRSDVGLALVMPASAGPRDAIEESGLPALTTSDRPDRRVVDRSDLGQHQENVERQLDPDVGTAEAEEAADVEEDLRGRSEQTVAATESDPRRAHRPYSEPD